MPAAVVSLMVAASLLLAQDIALRSYQDAASAGAVGTVVGRAYAERPKPNAPDQPLAGTEIVLLPRSEALRGRLEDVKRHARDSLRTWTAAAAEIRKLREEYEAELGDRGAGDLLFGATATADGSFAVESVPAGEWLLYAARAVVTEKPPSPQKFTEQDVFLPRTQLVGYKTVTVWLLDVAVGTGRTETVELTDRNPWFTGVEEERAVPPRRIGPTTPQRR